MRPKHPGSQCDVRQALVWHEHKQIEPPSRKHVWSCHEVSITRAVVLWGATESCTAHASYGSAMRKHHMCALQHALPVQAARADGIHCKLLPMASGSRKLTTTCGHSASELIFANNHRLQYKYIWRRFLQAESNGNLVRSLMTKMTTKNATEYIDNQSPLALALVFFAAPCLCGLQGGHIWGTFFRVSCN